MNVSITSPRRGSLKREFFLYIGIEEGRLDEPQIVGCRTKVVGTELEGGAEDPRHSRRSS